MSDPSRPSRDRRLAWVAAGVLIGGALVALLALGPLSMRSGTPLLGSPAPDFALPVVHGGPAGNRVRLSELRGRVVVLDFYASWCVPCREAAAMIRAAAASHPRESVTVLGVATADDADAAAGFATAHAPDSIAVHDADGAVALSFGADNLPTLVIVDREGIVIAVAHGVVSQRRLERLIAAALSG